MRLRVEGAPGELASRPADALDALAKAARLDGADDDWLEKARAGLPVDHDARYPFIEELVEEAVDTYRLLLVSLQEKALAVLDARIKPAVAEQLDQLP